MRAAREYSSSVRPADNTRGNVLGEADSQKFHIGPTFHESNRAPSLRLVEVVCPSLPLSKAAIGRCGTLLLRHILGGCSVAL